MLYMPYKRKKYHHGDTHLKKQWRTKRRKRDLDEINEDMKVENAQKLLNQEVDLDKPGFAQFYCIHCARYFIDDHALKDHFKTKVHKRRLKALELEPYTIEESERAAGKGSFEPAKKRKIETQPIDELEKNVALRGIPLNVKSLKRMWDFQEGVRANRNQLEDKRFELAKAIKDLMSRGTDDVEVEKLKILAQKVKREIKVVTSSLWDLENKVMPKLLSLPNVLHTRTPLKTEKILHTYLDIPQGKQALSHVDIGNSLGILKVIGPLCYFLKNEGVKFELGLVQYLANYLRSKGFVQFSNPDFVKSLVVEGCGFDHEDPMMSFILKRDNSDDVDENNPNRLHLTGGASITPFCSYFAKHVLKDPLPVKLFASGRSYSPSALQINGSLVKSCQASAVQLFVALSNCPNVEDTMFDDLLADLINAYENLGYHFKVSYVPPSKMSSWECLRASFQMYSLFSQSYVEVGNLSMCSDFVSKRLLMYYQNPDKRVDFMRFVTGTVLSVPKVLACVLEDPINLHDGKLMLPLPAERKKRESVDLKRKRTKR
ncbi:hypothetical protein J437_LFUL011093 [Ladona fulva]|uniref:Zinc finger protein 593 homolog n=1 Tax=Ladona fulva TaxID=123851 RepID=A0A8K0KCL1_LADFU|nr:hypothetical protein J437_LFUL011093 [Ladona fulva]